MTIPTVNLSRYASAIDPFQLYANAAAAADIVFDPDDGTYYVVGYELVRTLMTSGALYARGVPPGAFALSDEDREIILPVEEFYADWMAFSDKISHDRLRSALQPALSRRNLSRLLAEIRRVAQLSVTNADSNPIKSLTRPIARSILDSLIGADSQEIDHLLTLSRDLITYLATPGFDVNAALVASKSISALHLYVNDNLPSQRGLLMQELSRLDSDPEVSRQALVAALAQFLTGVVEPTESLLSSILYFMRKTDARTLILTGEVSSSAIVEEALRYDPPFHFAPRTVGKQIVFGGDRIPTGKRIVCLIAAANRDGRVWSEPDVFAANRTRRTNLSFGVGIHSCIGSVVARSAAEAVVDALVRQPERLDEFSELHRIVTFGSTRYEVAD